LPLWVQSTNLLNIAFRQDGDAQYRQSQTEHTQQAAANIPTGMLPKKPKQKAKNVKLRRHKERPFCIGQSVVRASQQICAKRNQAKCRAYWCATVFRVNLFSHSLDV